MPASAKRRLLGKKEAGPLREIRLRSITFLSGKAQGQLPLAKVSLPHGLAAINYES
jgi:hypothetical protein